MSLRVGITRVLVALALIVQIFAPVGATASVMRVAFDPLVDIITCSQDLEIVDRRDGAARTKAHHEDACELCQLVAPGGLAPAVHVVMPLPPAGSWTPARWFVIVETVVKPRLLDHIRGRAPPAFS